jgi:PhnB protein
VSDQERPSQMVAHFAHGQLGYLQIPALDVTASARFYERMFGWRVAPPAAGFEAPGLIGQWVTDRAPGLDAGPVAWIHVDDIDQALKKAVREGATVREGPSVDGPRMLATLADPAGNLVGIVQAGHGASDRRASVSNRTMPACTVIPQLVYDDVTEAIEWLCDKFGFSERWRAGDHRAQLSLGQGTVAITEPRTSNALPGPQSVMVRVEDAVAHHDRVRSRGARILQEPKDFPYGERQYTAEDLGGHHWTFSQSIADVLPEDWGGTSGPALRVDRAARELAPIAPTARAHVSVMLIVPDAPAALAWYKDALGASVLWDLGGVAGLEIAGAPFFLHEVNPRNPAENSPARIGRTSTRIELFVEDPDAVIDRAVARGATPGSEIEDHQAPWGTHRQGGFHDPFGHNWSVGDTSPLTRLQPWP